MSKQSSNYTTANLKQKQTREQQVIDSHQDNYSFPEARTQPGIITNNYHKDNLQIQNKDSINIKNIKNQKDNICNTTSALKLNIGKQIVAIQSYQDNNKVKQIGNVVDNAVDNVDSEMICCFRLYSKCCRVFMIILLVILIIGGISVVILLPLLRRSEKLQIKYQKPIKILKISDQKSISIAQMTIKDHHIFSSVKQINITRTQLIKTPSAQRRNLQQVSQNPFQTYITINFVQFGFVAHINPNLSTTILVNQTALMSYLTKSQHNTRLLEDDNDIDTNETVQPQDFYKQLSQQLNHGQTIIFYKRNYITFVINQTSKQLEIQTKSWRLLLQKAKKYFKKTRDLVIKKIKPTISIVKNFAPIIGTDTGAVIGFIITVPPNGIGSIPGDIAGYKIDKLVQALSTCIPLDSKRICCENKILQKQSVNYGKNNLINVALIQK